MSVSQERSAGGPHAVPPLTLISAITRLEMRPKVDIPLRP